MELPLIEPKSDQIPAQVTAQLRLPREELPRKLKV